MGYIGKKQERINKKDEKIINTAFRIFVEKKIEPVTITEIAEEAGVGRATVFRHYPTKVDLVIAVCSAKWKEYLDELDEKRPIISVKEIPAIDRLIFTLDSYIDMYQNHKDLLQYNDNFNHFVSHSGGVETAGMLADFHASLYSVDTRLHMMYKKAQEDHTFRTDIPEDEFMRVTVHTMMTACAYYAGGFIWGSEKNKDYTTELLRVKEMILNYVQVNA